MGGYTSWQSDCKNCPCIADTKMASNSTKTTSTMRARARSTNGRGMHSDINLVVRAHAQQDEARPADHETARAAPCVDDMQRARCRPGKFAHRRDVQAPTSRAPKCENPPHRRFACLREETGRDSLRRRTGAHERHRVGWRRVEDECCRTLETASFAAAHAQFLRPDARTA